jgi:hypothetical protein
MTGLRKNEQAVNLTTPGPRFSVTFERLYREEGVWKSSSNFGRDDLLVLAKVADLAHTWTAEAELATV